MTVEIRWDNAEKTSILFVFGRHWNWIEYDRAFDAAHELIRSVPHQKKVHMIVDLLDCPMPQGNAINHLRRAFARKPKNTGITVLVVKSGPGNLFEQLIFNAFLKMNKDHAEGTTIAFSLKEARRIVSIQPLVQTQPIAASAGK
jgi:hypothetical protein